MTKGGVTAGCVHLPPWKRRRQQLAGAVLNAHQ